MSERRKPYPFDQIEPKWQTIWEKRQLFHAPNPGEKNFDPSKPKFYILDMFLTQAEPVYTWGTPKAIRRPISLRVTNECAGLMYCIRWVGTRSVCRRSNTRSKPASTLRPRRVRILQNLKLN